MCAEDMPLVSATKAMNEVGIHIQASLQENVLLLLMLILASLTFSPNRRVALEGFLFDLCRTARETNISNVHARVFRHRALPWVLYAEVFLARVVLVMYQQKHNGSILDTFFMAN